MQGTFLNNTLQQQKSIVNCMAVNQDDVMVTGGDNGSLWCVPTHCPHIPLWAASGRYCTYSKLDTVHNICRLLGSGCYRTWHDVQLCCASSEIQVGLLQVLGLEVQ